MHAGHVSRAPHFNPVGNYLSDPALTGILKELVVLSSLPLEAVETDLAVDASGFAAGNFGGWYDKKYGKIDHRDWFKACLVCGVETKVVTGADMNGWTFHDGCSLPPLVKQTARNFEVKEVSADKACLSHFNTDVIESFGATPFIPFRSTNVQPKKDSAWARMYHLFNYRQEEFMAHYHKRSSVESVFSMMMVKSGEHVRSKNEMGQVNEVLCKVLCNNVRMLVQAMHELGIEPLRSSARCPSRSRPKRYPTRSS